MGFFSDARTAIAKDRAEDQQRNRHMQQVKRDGQAAGRRMDETVRRLEEQRNRSK